MKRFFQKMPEFLKYGAALIAGGLYIWAIIILLNNDNWIGISALTTMLLAIAAFWAIWQNYKFRKEDRQSQSLNEIRTWAREGLNLVTRIHGLPTTHANFPPVWEVTACLSYLESQRYTLLKYVKKFHNDDLANAITKALTDIKNCLESYKRAEAMNKRLDNARKCKDTLVEVLNEASKITNI